MGRVDRRVDKRVDKRVNREVEGRVDRRVDKRVDRRVDRRFDGRVDKMGEISSTSDADHKWLLWEICVRWSMACLTPTSLTPVLYFSTFYSKYNLIEK